jgi:hypothetical protein
MDVNFFANDKVLWIQKEASNAHFELFSLWRMTSSGMLRCVAIVITDVSEVTRIGELGTTLALTSNRLTFEVT